MVRVKHIAYVVNDLEESASFFEQVLGFRRYSKVRRPGNFPGDSMLITDGELNLTLLAPDPASSGGHGIRARPALTTSGSRLPTRQRFTRSSSSAASRPTARRGAS